MGLFEKIFPRGNKTAEKVGSTQFKAFTWYAPIFSRFGGSIYENELVRSAINVRATHISKLEVQMIGEGKPKIRRLMKLAPNEFSTWSQTLYRCSTILDVYNTCVIVPILDDMGDQTGIYPVIPERCDIVEYKGEPWLRYRFNDGKTAAIEYSRCGIMTKFQFRDDFKGESNSALSQTMDLITIQDQGIKEAVKNSAAYRFMAKLTNFTSAEDLAEKRREFSDQNFGRDANGGGLLLFPNTMDKIQQLKTAPYVVDQATMAAAKTGVYEYFGVNEDVLQNKAYGDAWSAFYEGCVEAFAVQFSEVLTKMCYTLNERSRGNAVMATANRLQYMSNADKLSVSAQMADRGIMNRDEIRAIWNLPPLPDGQGQAYTLRGEYKLLGDDNEVNENADE